MDCRVIITCVVLRRLTDFTEGLRRLYGSLMKDMSNNINDAQDKLNDMRQRFATACDSKFYADKKAEDAIHAVEEAKEYGASAADVMRLEDEAQEALDALKPLQDKCDKLSIALKAFVRMIENM